MYDATALGGGGIQDFVTSTGVSTKRRDDGGKEGSKIVLNCVTSLMDGP